MRKPMLCCDPLKDRSYDGFNMKFVREILSHIGNDITRYILNTFASGEFHPTINTTCVTLVPK